MVKVHERDSSWNDEWLETDERPKWIRTYYVTGHGPFPWDMLRYDRAWFQGSEDAAAIEGRNNPLGTIASFGGNYTVGLASYDRPTPGRWQSFGWTVTADRPVRKERVA